LLKHDEDEIRRLIRDKNSSRSKIIRSPPLSKDSFGKNLQESGNTEAKLAQNYRSAWARVI